MIQYSLKLLEPHAASGYSKIRVGDQNKDGGYIMIDDFKDIRVAISGGIGTEDSWEREILQRNIPVEAFDVQPSSFIPSYRLFVTPMTFYHYGNTTLDMILSGYKQHEAIMKLDIDSGEWPLFEKTSPETLNKIRQMAVEIHLDRNLGNLVNYFSILSKLYELFRVVHIHGNNYGDTYLFENNKIIPDVMEVTFANRNYYSLMPSNETFPTQLDRPCGSEYSEIQLGKFTF